MTATSFKARKAFDFNPHPFELGNILGLKMGYEDNHFLLKVYDLEEKIFQDYISTIWNITFPEETARKKISFPMSGISFPIG